MYKLDLKTLMYSDKLYCFELLKPENGIIELIRHGNGIFCSSDQNKPLYVYSKDGEGWGVDSKSNKYLFLGINLKQTILNPKDFGFVDECVINEINVAEKRKCIIVFLEKMKWYSKDYKEKISSMYKVIGTDISIMKNLF